MDHPLAVPASDDLSALAWVHEELRKTLESAHKALRRYLRDSEASRHSDLDDVEPTVLRSARQHLHQGVGALELVNIPEGAALLRAAEACVQRFVARPGRLDPAGVEAVERASFALLDYLARRLAGKPAPAVALFAQLRTLLELNGAERVHPADLWSHDWRWRDIPSSPPQEPPTTASLAALQSDFERRLLLLVRANAPEAAQALARDCDAVAATEAASGPGRASPVTFWRIAAAFFEAWSLGAIAADVFVKRTASRVMAQLRNRVKGDAQVSDRLAQDLLFFCARAGDVGSAAPRLAALRKAYPLDPTLLRVDYLEPFYGRFDPAHLQQARKRVAAAKETWNGVAGQELHRLDQLVESFTLVGDSVRRLYPAGEALAGALLHAAMLTARQARAPAPALAMEVATSLLYLDAALEEAEFDPAGQPSRSGRLAERIEQAISGNPPQALEPWMEELYRRVSDRQTMGSVVQELRSALSEVERQTDQFFRHPRENALLAGVPGQLGAMRGVFSVLGVDPAVQASVRMREDIESLLHGETDPHQPAVAAAIQRLAGNLGALGFLIDMLSVQPQMARALFRFNPDSGHLAPVMGRSAMAPDLIERAHAIADAVRRDELPLQAASVEIDALAREREVSRQPVLAATLSAAQAAIGTSSAGSSHEPTDEDGSLRAHVVQALDDFVATASHPVGLEPLGPSLVSRPIPLDLESPAPAFQPTGLEGDDEMRQVFLDESAEVLQQAGEALAALAQAPADLPQITSVRRAFHTLKGSARMVGFSAFGEAAWACEQLYNHWLAEQTPASADLRTFTGDALRYFKAWVAAIAATDDEAFAPEPVVAAAEALRLAGELMRIHLPGEFAPQLVLDAPEVAAPRPGLDTLDLEVPSESGTAPVMEALQATRPLELTPAELAAQLGSPAAAALDALPSALLDIDLGLDAPATGDLPADDVEPEAIATAIATSSTPVDLDLDSLAAPDAPTPSPAAELPPQWHEDAVVERIEIEALPLAEDSPQSWREPLQTRTTRSDAGTLDPALADTDPDTSQVSGLDPAADLTAEVPADVIAGSTGDASTHAPQDPAAPGEPAVQSDAGADIEPAPALAPPVAQVLRLEDFRPSTSTPTPPEETVDEDEDEDVKVIGPLRLQIPLFNIYLNEADELSRRLSTELAEWSLELHRPVGDRAVMLAHSLAGSSSTVGFADLSQLARLLEHALEQADRRGRGDAPTAELFTQVADEIRRLLHQFAAGFLRSAPEDLLQQLRAWLASQCAPADPASAAADDTESDSSLDTAAQIDIPVDSAAEPAQQVDLTLDLQPIGATPPHSGLQSVFPLPTPLGTSSAEAVEPSEFEADLDQEDQVDAELFPIFAEEADEPVRVRAPGAAGPPGQPGRRGQHHAGPHRVDVRTAAGFARGPDREPGALRRQLRDIELQAETQISRAWRRPRPRPKPSTRWRWTASRASRN
jgi:chemosensory pili system protein ChpA (sensor histidine kinase/response regulator)